MRNGILQYSFLLRHWRECWHAIRRLRGYEPQPVTLTSLAHWLVQFEDKDRKAVLLLLTKLKYFSYEATKQSLIALNQKLFVRFQADGITPRNVIYVQISDAGSSSGVILNLLRDAARLQQQGCRFIDGRDVRGLNETTNELGFGAIVYVDDFAGTGHQFCVARDFAVDHVVGTFSEFF